MTLSRFLDSRVELSHASRKTSAVAASATGLPGYSESPITVVPSPRVTTPENPRSTVPDATVSVQGVPLWRKPRSGPSLPAEVDTNTPRCIAANAPMAMGSWYSGRPSKPRESEMTSTPSAMAWSMAASTSDGYTPSSHSALYMATLARGAMPRAPNKDAPGTGEPAAVDEVCVPCPSVSRGELTAMVTFSLATRPLLNLRAPMSFRLHALEPSNAVPDSHAPFHRAGTGPSPSSRKLALSGHTPVSTTPTMTSSP
ncbi:hypothetical protein U9M48_044119 [Paspalum notatum var. saurae]|uniref:Uncharacterized protein n=1 Tax=Paspalum notatum var. saurae TaxID=547442 RepID=A0AAQ3UW32_PASNO